VSTSPTDRTSPAKRFAVDWDYPSHPAVVFFNDLEPGRRPVAPMTLMEAKNEVIVHFQRIRNEAQAAISETRRVRAGDLVLEVEVSAGRFSFNCCLGGERVEAGTAICMPTLGYYEHAEYDSDPWACVDHVKADQRFLIA
jgi:hypothetical protein